jgi:hypothetical protein
MHISIEFANVIVNINKKISLETLVDVVLNIKESFNKNRQFT